MYRKQISRYEFLFNGGHQVVIQAKVRKGMAVLVVLPYHLQ